MRYYANIISQRLTNYLTFRFFEYRFRSARFETKTLRRRALDYICKIGEGVWGGVYAPMAIKVLLALRRVVSPTA